MWVRCPKQNGGRSHCRSSFSGDIRTGFVLVDLERSTRRRHVLRSLPAIVISVAVTHLKKKMKKIKALE